MSILKNLLDEKEIIEINEAIVEQNNKTVKDDTKKDEFSKPETSRLNKAIKSQTDHPLFADDEIFSLAYFGYTFAQEHPFFSANKRTAAKCVQILAKKNKINGITYNIELFNAVKDSVDKSQEPLENYLRSVAEVKQISVVVCLTVVPFGKRFKDMSPPSKELMKLTLEGKLAHTGHPVLHWMMDNIFIRTDPAGNIKPDKEKSTEKIDGAVATIMALDRAIRNQNTQTDSVYNERGLIII